MHEVIYPEQHRPSECNLKYIVENVIDTAFIGQCGNGPDNSLYIIHESFVSLGSNPKLQWRNPNARVYVNRFVNVKITIEEICLSNT